MTTECTHHPIPIIFLSTFYLNHNLNITNLFFIKVNHSYRLLIFFPKKSKKKKNSVSDGGLAVGLPCFDCRKYTLLFFLSFNYIYVALC